MPDAKPVYTGYLENWELIYRSSKTGAYATIRRKKGYRVPVAVWNISETDERNLDIYEGTQDFIISKTSMYLQGGSRIKAMVYIMFNRAKPGRPSERYVDTVYKGYRDFKLDYEFLIDSILTNNDELKKERG